MPVPATVPSEMKLSHPINIIQIDHVVIRVNNLDQMIDFYTAVLGCQLEKGPGEMRLAQLRAGNSLIDLVDANGPLGKQGGDPADRNAPNMDHVCLQIKPWDVNAINTHLKEHGVEPGNIANRYGAEGNGPSMYINDPEGNSIELKGPGTT